MLHFVQHDNKSVTLSVAKGLGDNHRDVSLRSLAECPTRRVLCECGQHDNKSGTLPTMYFARGAHLSLRDLAEVKAICAGHRVTDLKHSGLDDSRITPVAEPVEAPPALAECLADNMSANVSP